MASIGVEPIRPFGQCILSPSRLPIPPRGRYFSALQRLRKFRRRRKSHRRSSSFLEPVFTFTPFTHSHPPKPIPCPLPRPRDTLPPVPSHGARLNLSFGD